MQCFWSVMMEGVFSQSINQSFSVFTGDSRNCPQETNVKKERKEKRKKERKRKSNHSLVFLYLWPRVEKIWVFSCGHESRRVVLTVSLVEAMSEQICVFSCGHESRRVVSLVVATSREELCLQLWPWVEKSCLFSCGHESTRVVSLVVVMSREELTL